MQTEQISIYEMHKRLCYKEAKGLLELEPYVPEPFNGTFCCFARYYELHYKPLIEQLAKEHPENARIGHLLGDLNAIFLGYLEEYDKE